jgi:carbamoyl-phosphate synthase large subunit
MKTWRVLVTGIGGDLGQAVMKALRLAGRFEIFGCDADATGIGGLFTPCVSSPTASAAAYIPFLDQYCRKWEIAAVTPASEPEIAALSRLGRMQLPGGAKVVSQPAEYLDIYGDKLVAMQALSGHVPLAPFADGENRQAVEDLVAEAGFPLVVKPRRSRGSRFFRVVENQPDLARALTEIPSPLVQQFLSGGDQEYTVGVFACGDSCVGIAFRRSLGAVGCSWYAETSENPEVLRYAIDVARASRLRGAANIQVRKCPEGVRLLEINPRFSSLAAARAVCGFNDVAWSVDLALGQPIELKTAGFRQIRFRRFFQEAIDFGDGFRTLPEWRPREDTADGSPGAEN